MSIDFSTWFVGVLSKDDGGNLQWRPSGVRLGACARTTRRWVKALKPFGGSGRAYRCRLSKLRQAVGDRLHVLVMLLQVAVGRAFDPHQLCIGVDRQQANAVVKRDQRITVPVKQQDRPLNARKVPESWQAIAQQRR